MRDILSPLWPPGNALEADVSLQGQGHRGGRDVCRWEGCSRSTGRHLWVSCSFPVFQVWFVCQGICECACICP